MAKLGGIIVVLAIGIAAKEGNRFAQVLVALLLGAFIWIVI